MSPIVALLLCIIFISIVFIIDLKEKSDVSIALWVPTIWMMICGSKAVALWLNPGLVTATEIDYTSGNPTDRVFLSIVIAIGLFVLSRRTVDWSQTIKNNSWIFILIIYLGLSILWSNFPGVSFKRWVKTTGSLVMVLVVLTDPAPVEAVKKIFRRCVYVLIPLSVLFVKYFPNIGRAYPQAGSQLKYTMWVGVTTHKNGLGQLCFVCAFFLIWNIITIWSNKILSIDKKKIFVDIILLLMALWLLNGSSTSNSKTSIGVLLIGVCFFTVLNQFKSTREHIGAYFLLVCFLFLLFQFSADIFFGSSLFGTAVESMGHDMTLSGRTDLWKDLINIGSNHAFLGAGYGSFWIGNFNHDLWDKYIWRPEQAHNGYIDVYVEVGLIGLCILLSAIFVAYRNTKKTLVNNLHYGVFRMTFLLMIIIYNITEASFTKGTSLLWFIFLLIAVITPPNKTNQLI